MAHEIWLSSVNVAWLSRCFYNSVTFARRFTFLIPLGQNKNQALFIMKHKWWLLTSYLKQRLRVPLYPRFQSSYLSHECWLAQTDFHLSFLTPVLFSATCLLHLFLPLLFSYMLLFDFHVNMRCHCVSGRAFHFQPTLFILYLGSMAVMWHSPEKKQKLHNALFLLFVCSIVLYLFFSCWHYSSPTFFFLSYCTCGAFFL